MKRTLFLILASLLLAAPAAADPADGGYPGAAMIEPGSWYATAGGGVHYTMLPDHTGSRFDQVGGFRLLTFKPRLVSGSVNLGFGYVFPNGAFPPWLGRNFRIELGGIYRKGSRTTGDTGQNVSGTGAFILLNGTNLFTGLGPPGFSSFTGSLSVAHSNWQIAVDARGDHKLARGWMVTPFLGVFGGRGSTDYFLRERFTVIANGAFIDALTIEEIDTWRFGLRAGAKLAWKITHAMRLFVGGHVGVAWQRSSYRGINCGQAAGNNVPLGGCDHPTVVAASIGRASDTSTVAAFVGGVRGGLTYNLGWLIVTVHGGVRYNSAVPGIQHPRFIALGVAAAPAQIRHEGKYEFTGGVRIVIPFSSGQ